MSVKRYPAYLVPKADYTILTGEIVKEGTILRSFTEPVFPKLVDGKIPVSVFTDPSTGSLLNHVSVNLLGVYQIPDAAWTLTGVNKAKLTRIWLPGCPGITPSVDEHIEGQVSTIHEVEYAASWGCWWLPLKAVYGKRFESDGVEYKCCIQHKPTEYNYWHFELHFYDSNNNDARSLNKGGTKRLASLIRMDLVQNAKTEQDVPALEQDGSSFLYRYTGEYIVVTSE